jgi:hypothetical protein
MTLNCANGVAPQSIKWQYKASLKYDQTQEMKIERSYSAAVFKYKVSLMKMRIEICLSAG